MNPAACSNPSWVALFTALMTPLVGFAVAYIAWRQWQTARNRLKFDMRG